MSTPLQHIILAHPAASAQHNDVASYADAAGCDGSDRTAASKGSQAREPTQHVQDFAQILLMTARFFAPLSTAAGKQPGACTSQALSQALHWTLLQLC